MNKRGFLLFDIDGVIRDVASSYRLAIKETVNYYCDWKPKDKDIDDLKTEGIWNNDWDASYELIKRQIKLENLKTALPSKPNLIEVFNNYYFGGEPNSESREWKGFINNEKLLVNNKFFQELTDQGIAWGFVSGAERPSAKFVLENRLQLQNPPLIAMGEAPEKPNPIGLVQLASKLAGKSLGSELPPVGYVGDTVADVLTIKNAIEKIPKQKFISMAVAPPHLQKKNKKYERLKYEENLKEAGANVILSSTFDVINQVKLW